MILSLNLGIAVLPKSKLLYPLKQRPLLNPLVLCCTTRLTCTEKVSIFFLDCSGMLTPYRMMSKACSLILVININDLPLDLLHQIIHETVSYVEHQHDSFPSIIQHYQTRVYVMCICWLWWSLMLESPELWNSFMIGDLSGNPEQSNHQMLTIRSISAWHTRSQNHTINLHCFNLLWSPPQSTDIISIMSMLSPSIC
jgi:hypothetical protein